MASDQSSLRKSRRQWWLKTHFNPLEIEPAKAAPAKAEPPKAEPPKVERAPEPKKKARSRPREKAPPPNWRWSVGRLTFFNEKRRRFSPPVVESVPLEAETIMPAFVSKARDPALPPGAFSGAVYRDDGKIVPEFLEYDALTQHRVYKRMNPPVVERARLEEAARVYGTSIYLGPLSSHFGHFLLESLTRAWYLLKADASIPVLFHDWNDRLILPPFATAILAALDVPPSRIRTAAGRDLRVAKLILPASQYWQGIKASPGMCVVFDHIRERMLRSRTKKGMTPAKIYLSRRSLAAARVTGDARIAISNEEEAEVFFRGLGYEILQPELLPIEEQVAIVANATHVAGPSGSALHLMLFNDNPQARLIELRTKVAVNQRLISAIRGNEAFHITCAMMDRSSGTATFDMDVIERALREIG